MANLESLNFDANQVQPNSFELLPAGEYEAIIVASSMDMTKDGTGKFLKLELQILNGEYQNKKLFDRLNLINPNDQAVQIARGTLSAICRAVGVMTPHESTELHNRPLRIKVGIREGKGEYNDQNVIKAYKPRLAGPGPAMTASVMPYPAQPDPIVDSNPW